MSMLDLYDSPQQFTANKLDHKSTETCLKLVVSNPPLNQTLSPPHEAHSKDGFSSDIQGMGLNLYSFLVRDPSHYLECELTLETQAREDENTLNPVEVICHFPPISDEKLNDYVWENETLLGIILIQFQMKIMEQLLTFCANQHASSLAIYADDAEAESLGIYREFLFTDGYSPPQILDSPKIIIPINKQNIQKWAKYMTMVDVQLSQTLWREQRLNPAIRQYLKTHLLG